MRAALQISLHTAVWQLDLYTTETTPLLPGELYGGIKTQKYNLGDDNKTQSNDLAESGSNLYKL